MSCAHGEHHDLQSQTVDDHRHNLCLQNTHTGIPQVWNLSFARFRLTTLPQTPYSQLGRGTPFPTRSTTSTSRFGTSDLNAFKLSASALCARTAPRNLCHPNPAQLCLVCVPNPLPVSFTNFITLPAPIRTSYIGLLQYGWYHASFFVRKFTFLLSKIHKKMLQLELLFWLKYAPNRLLAGSSPQTLLGELTVLPRPIDSFRRPTYKGRRGVE